jgi:hypothetical protein
MVSRRAGVKVCLIVTESFLRRSLEIRQVDGVGNLGKVEHPVRVGLFRLALSEKFAQAKSFVLPADRNSRGDCLSLIAEMTR